MSEAAPGRASLLRDPNMMIVFSVTLMAVMGVSSVSPVLPAVAAYYGITPQQSSWLIAAFTLPGVFFTPVAGLLGDRLGRVRVLVPSLVVFAVAGTACAFADSFELLIAFRVLQGIGAGSLGALNLAVVADLYTGHRRVSAMGLNNGVISCGAASYPLIGGLLAVVGWQVPFYLPLLAVPTALAVAYGLNTQQTPVRSTLGAYLTGMWVAVNDRSVGALFFSGFVAFTCVYGALLTYLPFLLEQRFGMNTVDSGLVLAANAFMSAISSMSLGRLTRMFSRRAVMMASFSAMAVPVVLTPFMDSFWLLFALSLVWGLGMGSGIGLIMGWLADLAPMEQRGAVLALNATMFRLGQTGGPAIMAGFISLAGLDIAYVLEGGVVFLAVAVMAVAIRR